VPVWVIGLCKNNPIGHLAHQRRALVGCTRLQVPGFPPECDGLEAQSLPCTISSVTEHDGKRCGVASWPIPQLGETNSVPVTWLRVWGGYLEMRSGYCALVDILSLPFCVVSKNKGK
jgi:hypothetical protein